MALAQTFNVPNVREDLTDILSRIDPETTPIYTDAAKVSASGPLHEWDLDNLLGVATAGILESTDYSSYTNQIANIGRVGNRVQIYDQTYQVSNVLQSVDIAGMASALATSKMKCFTQQKNSFEASIGGDQDQVAASGSVGAVSRGLGSWINNSAQAVYPVPSTYRTPVTSIFSGAPDDFNEDAFRGLLASQFNQTGSNTNNTGYVGTKLKSAISNFTKGSGAGTNDLKRMTESATDKEFTRAVDVYKGDFGVVDIVPDVFLGLTNGQKPGATDLSQWRGYFFPTNLIQVATLKAPYDQPLEDKGAGPRGYIRATTTLVLKNPLGCIKIDPDLS